ncbi:hypothetical protein [Xanthomonas bonasiae]|uniref:hypothetical protein n=1 Tax=Xanthomonas bonasiae TaxID=2810351 RepID=UPI00198031F0|nr:hypothetical protein [Xanthomonas bonasiae]MBN6114246.1 hypothetical protein [Xanthomonas bonasiae]
MPRALKRWTAVLIGLAALPAAAAPAAAPPQTVIYVTPVSDEAKVMSYVPVRNAPSEEAELGAWHGLKQPLRVFDKGAEDGMATPLAFSVDDNSMCGSDLRVRLKTAHGATFAHDALLASFDLNPGQRFTRRELDATQRRALLQVVGNDPSLRKRLPAAALKRLLAHLAAAPADETPALTVIADAKRPGHDVALVTASVYDPAPAADAASPKLTTLLAVLERSDSGWGMRKILADYGCDDCEERKNTYALLQFADIDADGTVDFLIQHSGYETYGFWLLHLVDGQWRSDDLVGGC